MKVRDIMTKDVRTCRSDTTLAEAVRLMWEKDCGVLPVVTADGKVSGMITDRDICVAIATRGQTADKIMVSAVIGPKVCGCAPDDEAVVALQTMKAQRVRRLPVLDAKGRLVGILSLNDIVMHAGTELAAEIVSAMTGICQHRKTAAAGAA